MSQAERRQQLLHPVEVSIFHSLRRDETARFADLMRPTGLTSDSFKFYLRRLVACGWVQKLSGGGYGLTPAGKEFANNLDDGRRAPQKQPKLSVVIVVSRIVHGRMEHLFQCRQRQPYYGRWGLLSGPVGWGDSFERTAARELLKQTGLSAEFAVCGFARVLDRSPEGSLLEDKLFAVAVASAVTGDLSNEWTGGQNEWLDLATLEARTDYFPHTRSMLELVASGRTYASFEPHYDAADY